MRNCRRIDDASRARSSWFFYANWACAPCPYHQAGSEIKRGISLWERSDYNVAARSFWQADLRKKQVSQVLSSTRHEPHRYVHFGKVHIECRQGRKLDRKQTKRLQRDEDTERERERERERSAQERERLETGPSSLINLITQAILQTIVSTHAGTPRSELRSW